MSLFSKKLATSALDVVGDTSPLPQQSSEEDLTFAERHGDTNDPAANDGLATPQSGVDALENSQFWSILQSRNATVIPISDSTWRVGYPDGSEFTVVNAGGSFYSVTDAGTITRWALSGSGKLMAEQTTTAEQDFVRNAVSDVINSGDGSQPSDPAVPGDPNAPENQASQDGGADDIFLTTQLGKNYQTYGYEVTPSGQNQWQVTQPDGLTWTILHYDGSFYRRDANGSIGTINPETGARSQPLGAEEARLLWEQFLYQNETEYREEQDSKIEEEALKEQERRKAMLTEVFGEAFLTDEELAEGIAQSDEFVGSAFDKAEGALDRSLALSYAPERVSDALNRRLDLDESLALAGGRNMTRDFLQKQEKRDLANARATALGTPMPYASALENPLTAGGFFNANRVSNAYQSLGRYHGNQGDFWSNLGGAYGRATQEAIGALGYSLGRNYGGGGTTYYGATDTNYGPYSGGYATGSGGYGPYEGQYGTGGNYTTY